MPRPRSEPDDLNVVSTISQLLTRTDYAALMFSRGVASVSPASLAALERAGQLRLDYVRIGSQFFVVDTPENQARIAAVQAARDARVKRRSATPGWYVDWRDRSGPPSGGQPGAQGLDVAASPAPVAQGLSP